MVFAVKLFSFGAFPRKNPTTNVNRPKYSEMCISSPPAVIR